MNAPAGLADYQRLQSEYTTQWLLSFFIFGLWVKTSDRYLGRQSEAPASMGWPRRLPGGSRVELQKDSWLVRFD